MYEPRSTKGYSATRGKEDEWPLNSLEFGARAAKHRALSGKGAWLHMLALGRNEGRSLQTDTMHHMLGILWPSVWSLECEFRAWLHALLS